MGRYNSRASVKINRINGRRIIREKYAFECLVRV
jgi:hypothetical protein